MCKTELIWVWTWARTQPWILLLSVTALFLHRVCDCNSLRRPHTFVPLLACAVNAHSASSGSPCCSASVQSRRPWRRWRARTRSTAALSPSTTARPTPEGRISSCWRSRPSPVRTLVSLTFVNTAWSVRGLYSWRGQLFSICAMLIFTFRYWKSWSYAFGWPCSYLKVPSWTTHIVAKI